MKPKRQDRRARESATFDRALGSRIKERRTELGIEQRALAETIDVSPAVMSRYESGEVALSAATLAAIAAALKCETGALVDGVQG